MDHPYLTACDNLYVPDGTFYRWYRLLPWGDKLELIPFDRDANSSEDAGEAVTNFLEDFFEDTIVSDGLPWVKYALENGLAPGQSFCVRFGEPEVDYYNTWEEGPQCDISWPSVEIVFRGQCSNPEASWQRFLTDAATYREKQAKAASRLKELQWRKTEDMFLVQIYGGSYDYPDLDLQLRTKRMDLGTPPKGKPTWGLNSDCLARCSVDGFGYGDQINDAFSILAKNVGQHMPSLGTVAFLKTLRLSKL